MTRFDEPLTQPASLDLRKLNQKFENLHPKDILAWCVINIPTGLVQVSEFNVDDMLITDLLYRELKSAQSVPVLFVDTLHHFPQTLELVAETREIYTLNLKVYKVQGIKTRDAFAAKYGSALWEEEGDRFTQLTQTEPLHRGLDKLNAIAWVTAHRRDQATIADDLPIFELDQQERLKVNPLANWTRKETWAYVFEHDVIYNPLHDQGYSLIGSDTATEIQDGKTKHPIRRRKTECDI